eukprot:TRINITY_DN15315_c0_g1_i1.p1 TRINITY_DN15315_c0_g1~~TRINITY_DN15315_c0_g1_i1.p1  ORF type:complete len:100 (-),score=28.44 TRINITY_DN15315_c0_g1_i1:187-486(-)
MMRVWAIVALLVALTSAESQAETAATGFLTQKDTTLELPQAKQTEPTIEIQSAELSLAAAADTRNEYEKTNIEAEVLAALFFAASLLICVLECCPPGKK